MCPFPPDCPSHVSLESSWRKPPSSPPAHVNRAQRGCRRMNQPWLGARAPLLVCQHCLGGSSSQVPPSGGLCAIRASRLQPLSSSPPSRARGNLNLLRDWLLGHYCSTQVILLAFSEAHVAFFACTTARWVNYFIFSFHKQAFW